jgi:hypothetical protein
LQRSLKSPDLCPDGTTGRRVLFELTLLAYVGAVGFVAAGIAASFYKLVTHEPARFRLTGSTAGAWLSALLFGAVTGPVILVNYAMQKHRAEGMSVLVVFGGIVLAGLWSCCLGVLVLELVLHVRGGFA